MKGAEKILEKIVAPMRGSHSGGSPPIRMVSPEVAFLLGCTSGRTVSVYSTGIPRVPTRKSVGVIPRP